MQAAPTTWNFNPTVSTSNVVEYDGAVTTTSYSDPSIGYGSATDLYSGISSGTGRVYDLATQPYDGYIAGTNPYNWKNPTAYTNSLVYPAAQQYYGGPSYVPLYGGPTNWVANPGIKNQSGQYVTTDGAYADLRPYDGTSNANTYSDPSVAYSSPTDNYVSFGTGTQYPYDSADLDYDGTNNGESFDNWKTATAWEPISGGNL